MEGHSSVRTCTYLGAYWNGRALQCAHLHIFGCLLEWKGTAVCAPAHIRVLIGMEGHSSVRTCTYLGAYWNGRALQCTHLHIFGCLLEWKGTAVCAPAHIRVLIGMEGHCSVRTCTYSQVWPEPLGTPYMSQCSMAVHLVISLPKILCVHRMYVVLANPTYSLTTCYAF
jgi:hypothetical protein